MTIQKEYYSNQRYEMLEFIPEDAARILEIGCGTGEFAQLAKKQTGCTVWGVEANPDAASIAASKLDKVISGTFHDSLSELRGNKFDAIVFNDVLEHFDYPDKVLIEVAEFLNPETGYIIASIPNVLYVGNLKELLIKKDWIYKPEGGILDYTHLRFFTKKSIVRMFENCGYSIKAIKGLNGAKGLRFFLFNMLTLGYLTEAKFLQYGCVAKFTGKK